MSGQSDGSIVIDTEIRTDGAKAGSEELQKCMESFASSIKYLEKMLKEVFAQPFKPQVDTNFAEERVAALEAQIKELQEATQQSISTSPVKPNAPNINLDGTTQKASSLQRQIEAVNSSVEKLEPTFQKAVSGEKGAEKAMATFQGRATALEGKIAELRQQLDAVGQAKMPTQEYQETTQSVEKAEQALFRLFDKQDKMQATGVKENSKQWKNLQYDIQMAREELERLERAKASMEERGTAFTMGVDTAQYQQLEATLSAASNRLAEMRSGTEQSSSLMSRLAASAKKALGYVGAMAKKAGGALVTGLKAAGKGLLKIVTGGKSANKQFSGLISGAKKFALSMLGARGVFALLRKAVSAYMSENQELQNTLNACWSGIGNLLGPIIERLINLVAKATSYVTSFLKLFGVFGGKAKKSAQDATGAAKELKNQVASFDELNIMGDKNSGGGTDENKAELPEVELPDWAKLMVDQIKAGDWAAAAKTLTAELNSMVSSVNWSDIGNKLGTYLGGALKFLATCIQTFDWQGLGANLGNLIANIFRNIDWQDVGVILMAKLSILLKLLTGFFSSIDGSKFGEDLYNLLYGIIYGTDWVGLTGELFRNLSNFIMGIDFQKLGKILSEGLITALKTISAAIKNFDWRGLGKKIADFINGIDWAGIIAQLVTSIGDIITGALELLVGLAENIDWVKLGNDLVDGIISVFTNIDWGNIVSLVFELIGAALAGAVTLVVTLAKRLWEMLTSAVSSTWSYFSKYIEECGGNVIEGLLKGIWDAIKGIGIWIYDHIFKPFIDGFKNAFGIHSPSTIMAEMGGFIIQGLLNGITAAWENITGFFSNALSSLGETLSGAWDSIKGVASTAWDGISKTVTGAWEDLKTGVSTAVKNVGTTVSTAWQNIKTVAGQKWDSIKATLSGKWQNIKTTASTTWENMKTTVSKKWDEIKTNASTKWENIKSTITNKGWSGVGSNICSGIANGINSGWSWLKDTVGNLASNLLSKAKSVLGIHSPSRVFRDAVGLNIGYGIGEGIEGSEKDVLKSVTGLADAIAEEANAGDFSIKGIVPMAEVDGALTNFTDKISNSFTTLLDRLQAIAERVTFSVPAVANGAIPYKVSASVGSAVSPSLADRSQLSLEELSSSVDERLADLSYNQSRILEAIRSLNLNIDIEALTKMITQQQRTNIRNFGGT